MVGYSNRDTPRFVFYGLNTVFWLMGWSALAVGIWLYVAKDEYGSLTPASYNAMSAAGLCASAGAMVIMIALIGCFAVCNHSRCLLLSYIFFVALLAIVQLGTGLMGFSYRNEVRERIRDELFTHLNSSYVSESNTGLNGVRISWHHLQQQMRCCGVDNYQDWYNTVQWPRNRFVPDSCCNKDLFDSDHSLQHCGQQQGADHLWYHEGCYKVFADWLMEHIQAAAILAIFFIIIELFLLSISMMLCIGMNKHKYKYHRGSRSHWNHA